MRSESRTAGRRASTRTAPARRRELATQLIVELAGARWTGETDVRGELPPPPSIAYNPSGANEAIGLDVPEAEQRERLEPARLRGRRANGDGRSPTWRARDVPREIDVVEEVARFRLEDVPATLPARQEMYGRLTHKQRLRRRVEDVLVGAGLFEAYTYSLQPEDPRPGRARAAGAALGRAAAPADDAAAGLVGAARRTSTCGRPRASRSSRSRTSTCRRGRKLPEERWRVGGIVQGGFFRAKGAVETLFDALKVEPTLRAAEALRSCRAGRRRGPGGMGRAARSRGSSTASGAAFELDLDELFARVPERIVYRDVITFPPCGRTSRSSSTSRCRRASCSPLRARPRARSCARSGSSSVYRGGAGRRRAGSRSRSPSRTSRPSTRSPTRTRRGCARRSSTRWRSRFGAELRA